MNKKLVRKWLLVFSGLLFVSVASALDKKQLDSLADTAFDERQDVLARAKALSKISDVGFPGASADSLLKLNKMFLHVASEAGDGWMMALAAYRVGRYTSTLGDYVGAEEYFEQAIASAKKINDPAKESLIYIGYVEVLARQGKFEQALENSHMAYEVNASSAQPDTGSMLRSLGAVSAIYMMQEKYFESINWALKAVKLGRQFSGWADLVTIYNSLGGSYGKIGLYKQAIDYYTEARKELDRILGEEGLADKERTERLLMKATIIHNISLLYGEMESFSREYEYLEKALVLAEQIDAKKLQANIILQMGSVYMSKHEYANARTKYMDAQKRYHEMNLPLDVAKCIRMIGNTYLSEQQYRVAESHYLRVLDMFDSLGVDPEGVSANLCKVYHKLKEYPKAKAYGEKALTYAEKVGRVKKLEDAYFDLYAAYRDAGDYRDALWYHERYHKYSDSTEKIENLDMLLSQEFAYENQKVQAIDSLKNAEIQAKKDQEIALQKAELKQRTAYTYAAVACSLLLLLLVGAVYYSRRRTQKKNVQISAKNAAIEKRNTQIEWLLKEIHHRVKNNMQIVSSLMSIQSRALTDDASKEVIRESQNRIKSMALVHESLYQAEDLSRIEIGPFVQRIVEYVGQTFEKPGQEITLKIETDNVQLNAEQAVPLGIIVNELSSNSYKHAFDKTQSGELRVAFRSEGEFFQLEVGDDGLPIPKGSEEGLSGKSIGMALVRSLAEEQLEGSFTVQSQGKAKFVVRFKRQIAAA